MYLFDTDVLSNLLKRSPAPSLIEKITALPAEVQFTSSITLGELVYGAYRLGDRAGVLQKRIEHLMIPNIRILSFDTEAARRYGMLRAQLEQAGTPLADADLRIASIALSADLTLVTGNSRHFQPVPALVLENWLIE